MFKRTNNAVWLLVTVIWFLGITFGMMKSPNCYIVFIPYVAFYFVWSLLTEEPK